MDLTKCEARPRSGGHTRPCDVPRAAPRRRAKAHRSGADERARCGACTCSQGPTIGEQKRERTEGKRKTASVPAREACRAMVRWALCGLDVKREELKASAWPTIGHRTQLQDQPLFAQAIARALDSLSSLYPNNLQGNDK